MRLQRVLILLLGVGGPGLLAGCGAETATVSGEVTMNGRPLEKGVISFVPAEGGGAPVTATIQKGLYEVRTAPGKKWVQISAPLVVGKRPEYNGPGAPLVEITAEQLAARFNSKTELTFEVKAGSNTKNWSVVSKDRKP